MSTGTSGGYWDEPALPSRLKHQLLKRHISQFGGKTGSLSPDKRVVYLDGYAGTGRYESGDPGSAEIAMQVATAHLKQGLRWRCFFVEQDAESVRRLKQVAAGYRRIEVQVRHGEAAGLLSEVTRVAVEAPLFLFLDPCGLSVPFDQLVDVLTRQRPNRWPRTELLMNFSMMAVRRLGGNVSSPKGNAAALARMDAACGGSWWREYFTAEQPEDQAAEAVAAEYTRRLRDATRMLVHSIPVAKQPGQKPVYHLVFATHGQHGLWVFGDTAARARDYWWEALEVEEEADGPLTLFSETSMRRPDPKTVESEAVPVIAQNLARLLQRRGRPFTVGEHTLEVFGDFYGQVKAPVVRDAVKHLHQLGGTATTGRGGKLHELFVTPPKL